jgi:hypothetical protein
MRFSLSRSSGGRHPVLMAPAGQVVAQQTIVRSGAASSDMDDL